MKTRRDFLSYFIIGISVIVSALLVSACGTKPDTETEPSPEWPPKE